MQSTEKWVPVPGYVGAYEVSDLGRVRSLPRVGPRRSFEGRVLRPGRSTQSGHMSVVLSVGGAKKSHNVHAIVMLAFVGEPPGGYGDPPLQR